jgi:uncharacterized RDD family membrane protein YckC
MNFPVPAPLWRRLAAALYDGLLLLALWMVLALFDALVRDALTLPYDARALRAFLFLAGLVFFGWFWTHGGQTLGMRAWRLQLRRSDGSAVHWPAAALRYAAAWLAWAPLGLGLAWCAVDPQRRAWHDRLSGTEVVVLPKPAAA